MQQKQDLSLQKYERMQTMQQAQQIIKKAESVASNGFYTEHLAEITNKGNNVSTSEDVFNDTGVLLVKKGCSIDKGTRDKLIKHKLIKPLDLQISLEDTLTDEGLLDKYSNLFNQYSDIMAVHQALSFNDSFSSIIKNMNLPKMIMQKLTVLESQMPSEFQKGLFCGWLSALTAREMGLDQQTIQNAFIAGLVHDIGLMHIEPAILDKQHKMNIEEWKMVQSHVLISKIILDNIQGIPDEVSRAVAEHHEVCDGTGYPFALTGHDRCVLGRVVAMTDAIHAIRMHKFESAGRNLGDILPYLQLNNSAQGTEVYRALMAIMKKSNLRQSTVNFNNKLNDFLKKMALQIKVLLEIKYKLEDLEEELKNELSGEKNKSLTILYTVISRMLRTLRESGLLSIDLAKWLHNFKEDYEEKTMHEINEIELFLSELVWQLRNTIRTLRFNNSSIDNPKTTLSANINSCAKFIDEKFKDLDIS